MRDLSGQTFGSYRLEDAIGQGGMGEVYRARHLRLTNRLAAVKVLPATLAIEEDFLQRFEHEANSAASLDHPAILPVWDYGEQDGQPYLAMPYIPGGSLKEYLEQHGTLSPTETLQLITPIAEALDYAHGRGIIHRDVKPANILLREDGRPLLADFGIAKAVEAGHSQGLTRSGMSIGTPEYMAPEQIEGKAQPRSDLYSLGVVAFQMLTGHVPYEGGTPYEIVYKQLHTPLPPLRWFRQDLSPTLEAVLSTALAKDPALRYPSGRAFVAAFREALGAAPNVATVINPVNSQATRRLDIANATTPLVTQPPRLATPPPPAPPVVVTPPPPTHYRDEPRRSRGSSAGLLGALIAVIIAAIGLLGVYVAFFMNPAPTPTPAVNAAATVAARTATANANAAAARTTATAAQVATVAAQATTAANQGAAAQATFFANGTATANQQAQQDATATAIAAQGAATATTSANATAAANVAATATGAVTQTVRANNAATATTVANATAAVIANATATANTSAAQTATVAARPTATTVPPTVAPTVAPTAAPPTQTPRPPTQTPRPPTQPPATNWGPALAPLTGGKTYNDPQERFSFNTPNNWSSRDPGSSEVAFNAPSGQASLAVNLSAASGGTNIEDLNKALEDEVKKQSGYSQVSLDKVLIDNHPAYRRIYKITQQGQQIQVAQYYFVANDLAHVITFACLPNDFKQFSPTFDNIAGTYKPNAR